MDYNQDDVNHQVGTTVRMDHCQNVRMETRIETTVKIETTVRIENTVRIDHCQDGEHCQDGDEHSNDQKCSSMICPEIFIQ